MILWCDSFLSVLGTRQSFFENCALIRLVGKAVTSLQAFNNKDCCCAAGLCAALATAALIQQFRKRLKTRGTWEPRGEIEAQISNLQFQRLSISIDAMHISIDGC